MADTSPTVQFLPAGDTALVVEFGDRIDRRLNDRVIDLAARIDAVGPAGVVETVPTFRSLLVHYDPGATSGAALVETIRAMLGDEAAGPRRQRLVRIPACYEADCAPDLGEVAGQAGLSTGDVVALHAGVRYHVYMIGFLLGYPYMGDLPPEIDLPRRTDPRTRVPAGSIAIAAGMTGIYPAESPGGWHLIGMTPIELFDPASPRPSLLAPGDLVSFEPVSAAEYDRLRTRPPAERVTIEEAAA